jgi:ribonucleotide monophosphatase NagD (HAD superfamily)
MPSMRRVLQSIAVAAAVAATTACGDPPDKELQQARSAVESARGAGADLYAREEFGAAETALKNATDAVDQRDYRLALNRALDARERAQNAEKEAVTRKAAVRTDASRALALATRALDDARAKLKTAEAARAPAKVLTSARRAIADADLAVQEARTVFGQGAYATVIEAANAETTRLRGVSRDLESAAGPAPRRRH